jgi:hypothetical protein
MQETGTNIDHVFTSMRDEVLTAGESPAGPE